MGVDDTKRVDAPFGNDVADAAAQWLTELMSGEMSAADIDQWRRWRAADHEHERAWQHIEAFSGRIVELDAKAAMASLSTPGRSRRRALKAIAVLGASCTGGYIALQSPTGQQLRADVSTAKGEQRQVAVGPHASVLLNTDTAINSSTRAGQARIELVGGEIIIDARGTGTRPSLLVRTAFAEVQLHAGKIQVREFPTHTSVNVLRGRAQLRGASRQVASLLEEGLSQAIGVAGFSPATPVQADATAWVDGQLIADDMPLGAFLVELARYRPGFIRCDPKIAVRTLSGVFPLADTDVVLAAAARATGATLRQRTRYWVVLDAA
ncbi:TPA: FecR domain-containing protein [Stenotrophomonas maltophilia]